MVDVLDALWHAISIIEKGMAKSLAFLQKEIDTRNTNKIRTDLKKNPFIHLSTTLLSPHICTVVPSLLSAVLMVRKGFRLHEGLAREILEALFSSPRKAPQQQGPRKSVPAGVEDREEAHSSTVDGCAGAPSTQTSTNPRPPLRRRVSKPPSQDGVKDVAARPQRGQSPVCLQWEFVWILVSSLWSARDVVSPKPRRISTVYRRRERSSLPNSQRVWRGWKHCAQKQQFQVHPSTSWSE